MSVADDVRQLSVSERSFGDLPEESAREFVERPGPALVWMWIDQSHLDAQFALRDADGFGEVRVIADHHSDLAPTLEGIK